MLKKTGSVLSQNKLLQIGELAEQADVAVGTVRYYETLRLLEPAYRSENDRTPPVKISQPKTLLMKISLAEKFTFSGSTLPCEAYATMPEW